MGFIHHHPVISFPYNRECGKNVTYGQLWQAQIWGYLYIVCVHLNLSTINSFQYYVLNISQFFFKFSATKINKNFNSWSFVSFAENFFVVPNFPICFYLFFTQEVLWKLRLCTWNIVICNFDGLRNFVILCYHCIYLSQCIAMVFLAHTHGKEKKIISLEIYLFFTGANFWCIGIVAKMSKK